MPFPVIPNPIIPPTNLPVGPGSVLLTNAPGSIPIKPVPWSYTAGDLLGPKGGYPSVDDALAGLRTLTDGPAGAAALVRDGERFVGYRLVSDFDFDGSEVHLRATIWGGGGIPWRNEAVLAVVDGGWVEHLD